MKQNFRYYVLDTKDAAYADTIKTLEAAHLRTWPKNRLSIVLNKDGSQALVKVDWGDQEPAAVKTGKLQEFTKATHSQAAAMIQTTAWKAADLTTP